MNCSVSPLGRGITYRVEAADGIDFVLQFVAMLTGGHVERGLIRGTVNGTEAVGFVPIDRPVIMVGLVEATVGAETEPDLNDREAMSTMPFVPAGALPRDLLELRFSPNPYVGSEDLGDDPYPYYPYHPYYPCP